MTISTRQWEKLYNDYCKLNYFEKYTDLYTKTLITAKKQTQIIYTHIKKPIGCMTVIRYIEPIWLVYTHLYLH